MKNAIYVNVHHMSGLGIHLQGGQVKLNGIMCCTTAHLWEWIIAWIYFNLVQLLLLLLVGHDEFSILCIDTIGFDGIAIIVVQVFENYQKVRGYCSDNTIWLLFEESNLRWNS